jgi:hypothetical protein
MVTFASPPREPNRWFVAPPPVEPVVGAALPRQDQRRRTLRQRLAFPVGVALLLGTSWGVVAQMPTQLPVPMDSFARNRLAAGAERLLRDQLPPAPRLADVRRVMGEAHLFCKPVSGVGADSLLTCLGHAVRLESAYSRMSFRVVSRGDSVTHVVACPSLVVHRSRPPAALIARARPTIASPDCWLDAGNPAVTEWAWAELPDAAKFTLVPDPDAPRMRVESAPSADTITVVW